MSSYDRCIKARKRLIKESLEEVEKVAIKYDIQSEEYHKIRVAIRGNAYIMEDEWLKLFMRLIDEKYGKKISNYSDGKSKNK